MTRRRDPALPHSMMTQPTREGILSLHEKEHEELPAVAEAPPHPSGPRYPHQHAVLTTSQPTRAQPKKVAAAGPGPDRADFQVHGVEGHAVGDTSTSTRQRHTSGKPRIIRAVPEMLEVRSSINRALLSFAVPAGRGSESSGSLRRQSQRGWIEWVGPSQHLQVGTDDLATRAPHSVSFSKKK